MDFTPNLGMKNSYICCKCDIYPVYILHIRFMPYLSMCTSYYSSNLYAIYLFYGIYKCHIWYKTHIYAVNVIFTLFIC